MIGVVGWIVLFAALLAWEGLGLVRVHDQWPTLSDMLRMVARSTVGRWALFAFWLWMGWHLFIRGWEFFLRGQLDKDTSITGHSVVAVSLGHTLRQDVGPVAGVFLLMMLMLTYYVTRTRKERLQIAASPPDETVEPRSWEQFFRSLLKTVAAGYAVFLAAMLLYYVGVARQDASFLRDVLGGGLFLAVGVAVPAFTAITWVKVVRSRRGGEAAEASAS